MPPTINHQHNAIFYDDKSRRKACDMLVIHSTASNNAEGTLAWFANPKNTAKSSAHYVVGRKGEIYQCVDEANVAYHAGKSEWFVGGKPRVNISYYSIGVEVVADQSSSYTAPQLEALRELCIDIMKRYNIGPDMVLRHSDVSPGRKKDPYPKNLDWEAFKKSLVTTPVWRQNIRDFIKQEHLENFVKTFDHDRLLYFMVRSDPHLSNKLDNFLK